MQSRKNGKWPRDEQLVIMIGFKAKNWSSYGHFPDFPQYLVDKSESISPAVFQELPASPLKSWFYEAHLPPRQRQRERRCTLWIVKKATEEAVRARGWSAAIRFLRGGDRKLSCGRPRLFRNTKNHQWAAASPRTGSQCLFWRGVGGVKSRGIQEGRRPGCFLLCSGALTCKGRGAPAPDLGFHVQKPCGEKMQRAPFSERAPSWFQITSLNTLLAQKVLVRTLGVVAIFVFLCFLDVCRSLGHAEDKIRLAETGSEPVMGTLAAGGWRRSAWPQSTPLPEDDHWGGKKSITLHD